MKLSDILRSNLLYGFLGEKELLDLMSSASTQKYAVVNFFLSKDLGGDNRDELGYILLAQKGNDKNKFNVIDCVQEYFTADPLCKKMKKINIENYYSCAKVKKALGIEIDNPDQSIPGLGNHLVNPCLRCHWRAIELMRSGKLKKVKKNRK